MEKLRVRQILTYLRSKKQCSIAELMAKFSVSSATIHRDIDELAKRDAVMRVRGGLIWNESTVFADNLSGYDERTVTNRKAKMAIARKALSLVSEGDILFLDSSTTVFELAVLLTSAHFQHLTIVTNSVSIMENFRKFPSHYVLIGLGGNYDTQLNSILGSETLDQLSRLTITKAFVSAFGVADRRVTTNHERQSELIRRVLDAAVHKYLLLDSSKLGRTGLYRLGASGTFDKILNE